MLALLKALPWVWRLGAAAALVGLLGGAVLYVRHQGYVAGYAAAQAQCEREKRAMEEANKRAIERAYELLEDALRKIELKEAQLDDIVKGIDQAALDEPGAGDECLSADIVRRLSTVQ